MPVMKIKKNCLVSVSEGKAAFTVGEIKNRNPFA
jgi:hypothetical protein